MPPSSGDTGSEGSALARQARWLERYRFGLRMSEQGRVISVGDGIAWIRGLPSAAMDELLELEDGSTALVFSLGKQAVGAILLQQTDELTAGTAVHLTGRRLDIGVGDTLLGRIVDPLGQPLDGTAHPNCRERRPLDARSPSIASRTFVTRPLYTGSKVIDTMIPIGKGQRQLLVGDNGVGKSSIALDTVTNQHGKDVVCVYVLIGQKRSSVVRTIETLRAADALAFSVLVVAEATASPGMKYLAPFAGCAIAEAWMHAGRDTLIVYDDLTTHAQAYRELSLLLHRPPGREAYPGDIFYLHSRLLERATSLSTDAGGGSMTALPIIETKQGEIAAYIPTNLISITDGQIYLSRNLFDAGMLPAIDVTRSVSRIGGSAQHPNIKAEAGRTKLDYLQFLELEVFTRFGTRLEPEMAKKIRRGRALREILRQERLAPVTKEFELAWLTAFNLGLFSDPDAGAVRAGLERLSHGIAATDLTLDSPPEQWRTAVGNWLAERPT